MLVNQGTKTKLTSLIQIYQRLIANSYEPKYIVRHTLNYQRRIFLGATSEQIDLLSNVSAPTVRHLRL